MTDKRTPDTMSYFSHDYRIMGLTSANMNTKNHQKQHKKLSPLLKNIYYTKNNNTESILYIRASHYIDFQSFHKYRMLFL
jgi:uncharacterized pyridoxamine 5'-phosphate oxidase family protein